MSLDTESSVGKECEKQGWRLHGGHTTKGAVHSLQLYTFGQSPFLCCYTKPYLVLNTRTSFSPNNLCLFFLISISEKKLWKSLHKAWFICTASLSVAAKTTCVLWNVTPCSLLPGAQSSYLANELDLLKLSSPWHTAWLVRENGKFSCVDFSKRASLTEE